MSGNPVIRGYRYAGTPDGDYLTLPDGALLLLPGGDQPGPDAEAPPSPWIPAERPAAYAHALLQLLPLGYAWTRAAGSVLARLLAAVGDALAAAHGRIDGLIAQSDPRQARAMLPEWEATVGLPTACQPALAPTVQQRAAEVHAAWVATGGATPAYFVAVAAAAGWTVAITEFRPPRLGVMRMGDEMVGIAASHHWLATVTTGGGVPGFFTMADNQFGDPFAWAGRTGPIECLFNRLKPAHTRVFFKYVAPPDPEAPIPDGTYLVLDDEQYLVIATDEFLTS